MSIFNQKLNKYLVSWLILVIIFLAYFKTWLWLGERWIANINNFIHLVLLLLLIFLAIKKHFWRWFSLKKQLNYKFLLLAVAILLFERWQHYVFAYSIISAIAVLLALFFTTRAFYKVTLSKTQQLAWMSLVFLTLPIMPLLGSTVGLLTRQIYVEIISLISLVFGLGLTKRGTSLISGQYITHIDASCSGVQGIFLLTVFILLAVVIKKPRTLHSWRLILKSSLGYLILNGVRIFLVVLSNNLFHLVSVKLVDQVLAFLILAAIFRWLFVKITLESEFNKLN